VIYYPSNADSGHWHVAALYFLAFDVLMLDNQAMASMTVLVMAGRLQATADR